MAAKDASATCSACEEAIRLVATSKTALGAVRVLLTVLSAAFDRRAAA